MGKEKGFLEYNRELPNTRNPEDRIKDYKEIYEPFSKEKTTEQAARCMDCGVPFCHNGCPLGNIIPEFNDAVYQNDWAYAFEILSSTNNFPEFTGRICPAPCEASCVLGINAPPVTIEHIEKSIAEHAFENNLVQPNPPAIRTGKKVAIVGSGPAGLAAAVQMNKAGHWVTVFERADRIGGLLRYGIPDFKLEKQVIDRRLKVMEAEGIVFKTNANVGVNVAIEDLKAQYDATILCGGSTIPRDLPIPGRALKGVHFAMDFLTQQNQRVAGDTTFEVPEIWATDKNVVVIGGGDTGSDCVGTSNRHGATSITQIELLSKPPVNRQQEDMWPNWPMTLRTSSSHEEGAERQWAIMTKEFIGDENGNLKALKLVQIQWEASANGGRPSFKEVPDTEQVIPCELALLSIGFVHPQWEGMLQNLNVDLDGRRNVLASETGENRYQTNVDKVFVAGDMRRGQSLVVWAISEGREAAKAVDEFLMGSSKLEGKEGSFLVV